MNKSDIVDANTMDIQRIITNLIDGTGIVKQLSVDLPRTCLNEVLTTLNETNTYETLRFQLNVYTTHINLTFFNK